MSIALKFDQLRNIRDLGGMQGADGKRIVQGKFIRCGHLAELSESDKAKLQSLTSVVVDFRTDGERAEKPDACLPGISYYHVPILDSLTGGITREEEADRDVFSTLLLKPVEAKAYMCNMYRAFAEREHAVSGYAVFLGLLMEKREKAILWHCTAGKDRAGVASAIVEEILGVSREDIFEDYLATNHYLASDILFLTEFVKKRAGVESELADESLRYLFGAEREYLESFYDAANKKYGDFAGFVKEGLRLGQREINDLRDRYLER